MDPDIDPDTAAMLADLDNARYLELAAPESRGRGPNVSDFDRAQAVSQREADRKILFATSAENDKHAQLQSWNTPANFGIDQRAAELEDRFGGQEHRARLIATLRDGGGGFQGGARKPDRELRGDRRQDRPQQAQSKRQARANQKSNPRRAPSPRLAGSTRFVNGVAVTQTGPRTRRAAASLAGAKTGVNAVDAARITKHLTRVGLLKPSASPISSKAPAVAPPIALKSTAASVVKENRRPPFRRPAATRRSSVQSSSLRQGAETAGAVAARPSSTATLPADLNTQAPLSTPGTIVFPLAGPSSTRTGRGLSVSSVATASSSIPPPDPADISRFMQTASRYRSKAVSMAASATSQNHAPLSASAPATSPLDTSPTLAPQAMLPDATVRLTAMPLTGSSPTAATIAPLDPPAPVGHIASITTEGPSIYDQSDKAREEATSTMSPPKLLAIDAAETLGHSGKGIDRQLLRIARRKIAEEVVLWAQNSRSEEAEAYFTAHPYRSWLLQPAIDILAGRSVPENLQTDSTVQAVVRHASLVRAKTVSLPSPPGSTERLRSKATGLCSHKALPALESTASEGLLKVDYHDSAGNHLDTNMVSVSSPVWVNVIITAKHGEYDPHAMADQMEALARHMLHQM